VASLEIVDYVAIVDEPSAAAAIEALRPDVYVKGPEYSNLLLDKTSNISHEKTLIESYGGRIHFTSGETFSPPSCRTSCSRRRRPRRTIPCSATIA
jgi:bifunctional ADP-heptose synthase (sugar kinase/adenylyltransferase)